MTFEYPGIQLKSSEDWCYLVKHAFIFVVFTDDSLSIDEKEHILECNFDSDKILNCSIEQGQTIVHGPGGRGYCLGNVAISSGKIYNYSISEFFICLFF